MLGMLIILTVCLLSRPSLFFLCVYTNVQIHTKSARPWPHHHFFIKPTTTNKSYTQLSSKSKKKKKPKPIWKSSKHIYMSCTSKPILKSTPKSHFLNSNSQAWNQKHPVPHFTNPNLNHLYHFSQQKNQSLYQPNQKPITKPNTKGGLAINKMRK